MLAVVFVRLPVPLDLALLDQYNNTIWKKGFTAPYEGKFTDKVSKMGTRLSLTIANPKNEGIKNRTISKQSNPSSELAISFLENEEVVSVFPNPVVIQKVKLSLESVEKGTVVVEVLNMVGKPVLQKNLSFERGKNLIELNLKELPQGNYILRMNQGQQQSITRLIVAQ